MIMKKGMEMENKIVITFVIVAIVGTIIGGICSAFGEKQNFITFDTIACGGILALYYLVCIGIKNIRRHKLLVIIGVIDFFLIILFFIILDIISKSWIEVLTPISHIWERILITIEFIIVTVIAVYQGKELLEEDSISYNSDF